MDLQANEGRLGDTIILLTINFLCGLGIALLSILFSNFSVVMMLYYVSTAAGIHKGMEKMRRAFEIYPYCAMSLNYLANHFFFTGQHFLVEQLTETALAVTNHGPTKSHSYYNLARSYHSKVQILSLYLNISNRLLFKGFFFLL